MSAAALLLFCAYLVRIGKDEMFLLRLFLPVWPLALVLAAEPLSRTWRLVPLAVCVAGLLWVGTRLHTINYWLIGQRSHVALAELMRKHAKPGDLVIFQDLGETPWAAMELRFVDPIGLVDREIARVRWRERNSPFVGLPSERGVAEILDHLFALEPRLVAFVAYTQGYESEVRPRVDAARTPAERAELFVPFMQRNVYYCRMWEDSRFQQRFRVVDVVRRKDNYWFILYERI